jgi:hypothetical protein
MPGGFAAEPGMGQSVGLIVSQVSIQAAPADGIQLLHSGGNGQDRPTLPDDALEHPSTIAHDKAVEAIKRSLHVHP